MDQKILAIIGCVALVAMIVIFHETSNTGHVIEQISYAGRSAPEYDCMGGEVNGPVGIGGPCIINEDCECGAICSKRSCLQNPSRCPVEAKIVYPGYFWKS